MSRSTLTARGLPPAPAPAPPRQPSNTFLLLPLTLADGVRELPVGVKVAVGRRSHPLLQNLHISREQATFELKRDIEGRILISMTNVRRAGAAARARARR
jgi:hypothetical protein